MKIKNTILSVLLLHVGLSFGQGVKFTASVNKNPVGTGDVLEITFSVNGSGARFNPPDFKGFEVVGGPNESTSMESVNGKTTVSTAYSYELMATKEGEFTIAPASMIVNGHLLNTRPVKIKVVKGSSVPQNNPAQSAQANTVTEATSSDLSKSLFIKAVVDKTNVYLGQQIALSYKLYTRVNIQQNQATELPGLNGFFSEEIKQKQQQIPMHIETYKGVQYDVADIKKSILFPERAGDLTIDPLGMAFVVQVKAPSTNLMDQFFGSYKQVKYQAKSAPVIIHVKPLPDAGKPDSFTGAVGNFSIESAVDKTALKVNDAFNYKIKISGTGNIKLLKPLNVNFPPDFEKYDPKISDSISGNENGISGYRYYNYLLIPRHKGDFTIGPLKFSYFNPVTKRYVTLAAKGFQINVDKGTTQNNVTAFSDADKQDVKMLDKDIRYIKTDNIGVTKPERFFGSFWYFFLLLIGPVLCYGAYIYRNRLIKNNSDIVKVKSRQAGKIAAKHLANAQKQLLAGNSNAFYEAVFNGLYGYLSDKLNIQYANLDKETITSALKAKLVNESLAEQLLVTLSLCEMARYAPVMVSQKEVFEKAKSIINDLENEF